MIDRIITFDICSIITLIILLFSLVFRKMTKGIANIVFIVLTSIVLLSGIFDVWRIVFPLISAPSEANVVFLYLLNYLYFLFRTLSTPFFVLFIFAVCGMWHEFSKDNVLKITWLIPVIIILGFLFVDVFIHKIFVIDSNLNYERGPLLKYLWICAIWIMAFAIITIIYNRNMLSKSKYIMLLCICPINIIGIIIQMYYPKYLVEVFFTTFPLLLVSLVIQKPEEIIDKNSGSLNYLAFLEEIKRNFLAKRKMHIIEINIEKFEKLTIQLGKKNIQLFLKHIISGLYKICKNKDYDIYYLSDGCFAIVSLSDNSDFEIIAQQINLFMEQKHIIENFTISFDFKLCYINTPEDLKDYESVIHFGKNMLNIIREKNSLVYLSDISSTNDFKIRHQIDRLIVKAISNQSFQMYYQPIYEVNTRTFISAEALIRLYDDELGFISPGIFIPASERNGAIHQIGDFVLDDVAKFISKTNFSKYGLEYVEINLSVAQCIENDLIHKVDDILKKYNISSNKINFEITETGENINHEVFDKNIKTLSKNGFTLSLDDYGTGYSNVWRITQVPLDIIKLDKSFVDDLEKTNMKTVIEETVSMLKKLNKKILVEGVETYEQLDYFRDIGCDYIQGYYFSKPLPEEEFLSFLKNANEKILRSNANE